MKSNFVKGISYNPWLYYDKERVQILKILRGILFLTFKDKTLPTHYLSRHLYKKEGNNIDDYLPLKVFLFIYPLLNGVNASQILSIKLFYYLHFSKFFRYLANVLLFNHKDTFAMDNGYFKFNSVQKFEMVILDQVNNKSPLKSIFIEKICDTHVGIKTYRNNPVFRNVLQELNINY